MATIAPAQRLDAFSQFRKLGNALASLFTSQCESTDSAFRRVYLMKRDEQGNIRLFDKKDPVTGVIRKDALLNYIEDARTGEIYLDEPQYIVAVKCALIALGMPLYTFGRMAWNAVKTPLEIGTIALDTLSRLGEQLRQCHFSEAASAMKRGCVQILGSLGNGLFEIVKAPLFMFGCELAAIYGIFRPYHGRKFEGMIENAWQRGASYKEDFVRIPARPGESCWESFRKDIMSAHAFYFAQCFQVRGNINSSRITVIKREPV